MKKLSVLFIALQFVAMNLFAYSHQETPFEWQSNNGQMIVSGGTLAYTNGTTDIIKINYCDSENAANESYYSFLVDGQYSHQSDAVKSTESGRIVITMTDTLKEGDIITFTGYQKNAQSTMNIQIGDVVVSAGGESLGYWPDLTTESSQREFKYTVAAASEGESVITLTLNEGTEPIYITHVEITRQVQDVDMGYQFLTGLHTGYLSSFCFPYSCEFLEDVQFYIFEGIHDGYLYGTPVEGKVLEAGMPYLYIPTAETMQYRRTDANELEVAPKSYNGIHGNFTIGRTLYGSKYEILTDAGLQYCNDNGNKIRKYGCYFVTDEISRTYSSTSSAKAVCLSSAAAFLNDASVTAINMIEAAKASNTPVYNLSGQRVSSPVQGGVYIINGKKVVIR